VVDETYFESFFILFLLQFLIPGVLMSADMSIEGDREVGLFSSDCTTAV
jgi:hypothetical protein